MIDNLSIAVHAFTKCILISLSVDEKLLPKYMNLSTNFKGSPYREEMAPFWLKHVFCFACIYVESNATCCLLQAVL